MRSLRGAVEERMYDVVGHVERAAIARLDLDVRVGEQDREHVVDGHRAAGLSQKTVSWRSSLTRKRSPSCCTPSVLRRIACSVSRCMGGMVRRCPGQVKRRDMGGPERAGGPTVYTVVRIKRWREPVQGAWPASVAPASSC